MKYNITYWIKGAAKFEEGATVLNQGNGWVRVIKQFEAESQEAAMKHTAGILFPLGSCNQQIEFGEFMTPCEPPRKQKRMAAWKQNPFNRFAAKAKA